ncbi:MAG: hypothetical protein D6732_19940 [Methanobacteriota archaeon]|nr:MAG: hypothetical protein D6732_19940 [Euryarchaeota archaeon]
MLLLEISIIHFQLPLVLLLNLKCYITSRIDVISIYWGMLPINQTLAILYTHPTKCYYMGETSNSYGSDFHAIFRF